MEEKIKKNIVIFNQLCLNLFEKNTDIPTESFASFGFIPHHS